MQGKVGENKYIPANIMSFLLTGVYKIVLPKKILLFLMSFRIKR